MKKIFIILLLLLVSHTAFANPIKVVCTIGQITDAVKNIGGKYVDVKGLMGAGVDPHLYKASESDVRKLSEAQIIFYNGLNLEAKMSKIFEKMNRGKIVSAVGESLSKENLLDSINYAGHPDPHIWFDVQQWMKVVTRISEVLIQYDINNRDYYFKNTEKLLAELEQLDEYIFEKTAEIPEEKRILVTAHDAFRYFGRRYGFRVVGLQGMSTESEAGTKDVAELAKFIAENKIKAIFIESSVSERNIKAVQEAVNARGWKVVIGGELFSDAMGDENTFKGTYIGMIRHNIDTIVDALK